MCSFFFAVIDEKMSCGRIFHSRGGFGNLVWAHGAATVSTARVIATAAGTPPALPATRWQGMPGTRDTSHRGHQRSVKAAERCFMLATTRALVLGLLHIAQETVMPPPVRILLEDWGPYYTDDAVHSGGTGYTCCVCAGGGGNVSGHSALGSRGGPNRKGGPEGDKKGPLLGNPRRLAAVRIASL